MINPRSILFIFIFFCFLFTVQLKSQIFDQEEVARKSLVELKNKLDSISSYKEWALLEAIKNNFSYCSELVGLVSEYKAKLEKNNNIITEKINQRNQIDLSERFMKITGTVESIESGFSMINTGQERFSIKGTFKYNQSITGSIKYIGGTTNFKVLGGGSYNLDNYELVHGQAPREKYDDLSNEIDKIREKNKIYYTDLIGECLTVVNKDIEKYTSLLLAIHYKSGIKLLGDNAFEEAYNEFGFVISIKADYEDVQNKYSTAKNNFLYGKASYFAQVGDFNKSYNIYLTLSYPLEFKDAKQLFDQTFRSYISEQLKEVNKKNDLNGFLAIFDTIETKSSISNDEGYFKSIKKDLSTELNKFAQEYFYPTNNQSKYTVVPDGYFLSSEGKEIFMDGFLFSNEPINYLLLRSFEVAHDSKLNFSYSKLTPFDDFYIPPKILSDLTNWIGGAPLSENDKTYIACAGWISIKEKEVFSSSSDRNASSVRNKLITNANELEKYNNHYKFILKDLKDGNPKEDLIKESLRIKSQTQDQNQQIKELAYNTGKVIAPKRLYLIPKAGISFSTVSWNAPASISTLYPDTRVHSGFLGYQFNLLFGINFDDNQFIGTEIYHGLGINFSYFFSSKPTSKDVSFSNNPSHIEMFYNTLEMTEFNIELRYSNGAFIGIGYSKINFDMTYQALGQQLININEDKKASAFSLSIGLDGGWYELYIKSIIGTEKDGPYSWDSKNLSGNVQYGLKIGIPIRLMREEPVFY